MLGTHRQSLEDCFFLPTPALNDSTVKNSIEKL